MKANYFEILESILNLKLQIQKSIYIEIISQVFPNVYTRI